MPLAGFSGPCFNAQTMPECKPGRSGEEPLDNLSSNKKQEKRMQCAGIHCDKYEEMEAFTAVVSGWQRSYISAGTIRTT